MTEAEPREATLKIISELPDINQRIIQFLVQYIRDNFFITDVQGFTKMDANNFATLFAPCFMRYETSFYFSHISHHLTFSSHRYTGATMEEMLNFVDGEIQWMLNLFKYVPSLEFPSEQPLLEAHTASSDGCSSRQDPSSLPSPSTPTSPATEPSDGEPSNPEDGSNTPV